MDASMAIARKPQCETGSQNLARFPFAHQAIEPRICSFLMKATRHAFFSGPTSILRVKGNFSIDPDGRQSKRLRPCDS